jgi:hypothetical protein
MLGTQILTPVDFFICVYLRESAAVKNENNHPS